MIQFGIFLILVIALAAWKKNKIFFNIVTVMNILWSVIIVLSRMHLFNLNAVSSDIYFILLMGILAFDCGCFFSSIKMTKHIGTDFFETQTKLNYSLIYILLLLCIPFYLMDFSRVIFSIGVSGFSLRKVQSFLQESGMSFNRGSLENAFRLLIVNPFTVALIPILATDFWIGERNRKLFILSAILIGLKIVSSGGRSAVIQLAFCFFFMYELMRKKESIKVKGHHTTFVIFAVFFVTTILFLSYSRAGKNLFRTIYYDFAMPPRMYEIWSEQVAQNRITGFGLASMNGLLTPIDYILRNLFQLQLPRNYQEIYALIQSTDTTWQWIGSTVSANAYASAFWFFFVDGGNFGVVLGMLIYGVFARNVENKGLTTLNEKSLTLYSIILLGIVYSFGRLQFSQSSYVYAILFILFFAYKSQEAVKGVNVDSVQRNRYEH